MVSQFLAGAGMNEIAGTFRTFSLDVTGIAKPGAENALAVEVFPPTPDSLALTWVDWNPGPPDKDMGIWRSVYVTTTGPVVVRYPHVTTQLEMKPHPRAQLTVTATLLADPTLAAVERSIGSSACNRRAIGASGFPTCFLYRITESAATTRSA